MWQWNHSPRWDDTVSPAVLIKVTSYVDIKHFREGIQKGREEQLKRLTKYRPYIYFIPKLIQFDGKMLVGRKKKKSAFLKNKKKKYINKNVASGVCVCLSVHLWLSVGSPRTLWLLPVFELPSCVLWSGGFDLYEFTPPFVCILLACTEPESQWPSTLPPLLLWKDLLCGSLEEHKPGSVWVSMTLTV